MNDLISKPPPSGVFRLVENQWTKPFWDAARRCRLVAPRCTRCGVFRFPPTPFCPACQSQAIDWVELSGQGVVYSYTVVVRALTPEMESSLPYVTAVVTLPDAKGVRLISNILDAPLGRVRIGAPVHVVWDNLGDVTVPRFRLDPDSLERA